MTRLLITGAAGMLGQDVALAASKSCDSVLALSRAELDITDTEQTVSVIAKFAPDAVINCAAWTDVDGAESSAQAAHEVNEVGALNVAAAAALSGAFVLHVSSDYVFDGAAGSPYAETAATNPQSVYGSSKLAGEHAVAVAAPDQYAIVRTSWLFGLHGKNFVDTILTKAETDSELRVVADQIGCPTWTGHLAPALVEIASKQTQGIIHLAGAGSCTWFDLARAAVAAAELDCQVLPVPTTEFPRPAARPACSALISTRTDGPCLPSWRTGLYEYLTLREELATAGVTDQIDEMART